MIFTPYRPPLTTPTSLIDDLLGRIDRQYATATGTVTSRVSGESSGQPVTGVQVWWSDPPRIRTDLTLTVGGSTSYVASYVLPDSAFGCVAAATGTITAFAREQIACTPVPRDEVLAKARADGIDGRIRAARLAYRVALGPPLTLGTNSADCFDVRRLSSQIPLTASPPRSPTLLLVDEGRYCYSYSGLLLYARVARSGASLIFEATEVLATADPAAFDPPR